MLEMDQLVNSFAPVKKKSEGRNDDVSGLVRVIGAALPILNKRLQADSTADSGPAPMLVFGGTFQCFPLRSPNESTATASPLTKAQLCHEAGLLFGQALTIYHLQEPSPEQCEELVTQIRSLGERALHLIGKLTAQTQQRANSIDQAMDELRQLTDSVASLEKQLQQLKQQQTPLQKQVDSLRSESAGLEKNIAELREVDTKLTSELNEAREKMQSIASAKHELETLHAQIGSKEKESEALVRQAHDLRMKLRDSEALVEAAKKNAPADVTERIQRIWNELPKDEFDRLMKQ